ncbi:MAG: PspA/IM30 family protein [Deltaproteobacteria bacterium]|nr:PspA/IM30 family protein [Deltaproteobacteria bacterium]
MAIMTRFMRLCKADIHGVMDHLEDKGLVLKQHLRDMEEEVNGKEARLNKIIASRDHVQREHEKFTQETEKMDQDIAVAIEKEKDDIARVLIKKLKPIANHRDELGRHLETLDREITQFGKSVEEQRLQYEQLKLRCTEYFRAAEREQWDKTVSTIVPHSVSREPSEEEVELELLQRKESIKGGVKK